MAADGPDEVEAAVNQLLQQEPDLFRQLPEEQAARAGGRPDGALQTDGSVNRPGSPASADAEPLDRSGSRPDPPAGGGNHNESTAPETAAPTPSSSPSLAPSDMVWTIFFLNYSQNNKGVILTQV